MSKQVDPGRTYPACKVSISSGFCTQVYPGVILRERDEACLVRFENGATQWVEKWYVDR